MSNPAVFARCICRLQIIGSITTTMPSVSASGLALLRMSSLKCSSAWLRCSLNMSVRLLMCCNSTTLLKIKSQSRGCTCTALHLPACAMAVQACPHHSQKTALFYMPGNDACRLRPEPSCRGSLITALSEIP